MYGMGVAFFGLNSIITLSAIACERYIVITSSSCRPVVAKWRITRRQAQKVRHFIAFSLRAPAHQWEHAARASTRSNVYIVMSPGVQPL